MSTSNVTIQFPEPFRLGFTAADEPSASDSFSVDAQGNGSFTGLDYSIPAHTKGTIKAKIETLALTSEDVNNLNNLIKGMVSASEWNKVHDYEETHASADLSFWGFLSGGGSASYTKTHDVMSGMGLSEENIKTIVDKMSEIASKMSNVEIDFEIDNSANDYSVDGKLLIYTIAGVIKTSTTQTQYRLLANQGTAGVAGSSAPASGNIIPLT